MGLFVTPLDWTKLPHEDWCKFGSTHKDCCPPDEYSTCSCLTREVLEALLKDGWAGPHRCGVTYANPDEGTRIRVCTRPAGHYPGNHYDDWEMS